MRLLSVSQAAEDLHETGDGTWGITAEAGGRVPAEPADTALQAVVASTAMPHSARAAALARPPLV